LICHFEFLYLDMAIGKTYLNGYFFEFEGLPETLSKSIEGIQYKIIEDLDYEPVTLEFFKNHIRVDFEMDDNLLQEYLRSSRQELEQYSQLSFGTKKIKLMALRLPKNYRLMYGPVVSIVDDKYELFGDIVKDADGQDIEFEFITGWGANGLPTDIKVAICQHGAGLYINRENILSNKSGTGLINQALKTMDYRKNIYMV
jgi:hypothetical protein